MLCVGVGVEQIPLAKYLATKGEVYANTRLSELLAEQ